MRLGRTVLSLLLILSSCDAGPASSKNVLKSNGGRYRVSYRTSPDPIPLNQPFSMTLQVEPGSGDGRTVEVDARMPAHGHGMNRAARVSRLPDGAFLADGLLFHMPGHWEIYVDISEAGRTDRAQVDVDLK